MWTVRWASGAMRDAMRGAGTIGVICALALLCAGTPGAAATAGVTGVVSVTATGDALHTDTTWLRPGAATFQVRTPDPSASPLDNHWVGLLRLHPGASLDRLVIALRDALFAEDPQTRAAAEREVNRTSTALGGVSVHRDAPQSFTKILEPGTYYLLDYQLLTKPNAIDLVHLLTVSGRPHVAVPDIDGVIIGTEHDGRPAFLAPDRLGTRADLLVTNALDVSHEAILLGVPDGTTDEDIRRYFADSAAGKNPPSPFRGDGTGMIPLSPRESLVLHLTLAPGTYVLTCWVADSSGLPHAMSGMFKVIVVR